jgi:hypothetical protein
VTPRRLEIFDVEMHLALRPDGSLACQRPIPGSSGSYAAHSALTPDGPMPPPDAGTKDPAAPQITRQTATGLIVKQMAASICVVKHADQSGVRPRRSIVRHHARQDCWDDETANQAGF